MNRLPLVLTGMLSLPVWADSPEVDARRIAEDIYYINHFFAVDNISYGNKRQPMQLMNISARGAAQHYKLERHLNNSYEQGDIRARDLVIFRSGKLRSTGILVISIKTKSAP